MKTRTGDALKHAMDLYKKVSPALVYKHTEVGLGDGLEARFVYLSDREQTVINIYDAGDLVLCYSLDVPHTPEDISDVTWSIYFYLKKKTLDLP